MNGFQKKRGEPRNGEMVGKILVSMWQKRLEFAGSQLLDSEKICFFLSNRTEQTEFFPRVCLVA
jgi:hypothetical protein